MDSGSTRGRSYITVVEHRCGASARSMLLSLEVGFLTALVRWVVLKNTGLREEQRRDARANAYAFDVYLVKALVPSDTASSDTACLASSHRAGSGDQAHGGLDLARREGALLVVADQLAGLDGDALESRST